MDYRLLGNTGLRVSALSFGASPLGSVFEAIDEREGIRSVHFAIDHGINLFDVSPYYGLTRAETVLGQALAGRRHKIVLATKAGRYGEHEFDFRRATIKRSVEESLARLQTDYVDILQAHDIEFGSLDMVLNETYAALVELKQEGKCRFIGMTGYPIGVLRRAVEYCKLDVVLSYCHFALYNTRMLTELLPVTQSRGVAVINASPTGMGLLTQKGPPPWHPAPLELVEKCREATAFCQARGVDIVDLALQYVLQDERIPTTLVGMSKCRHVERNLKAAEGKPDPALLTEVLAILEPVRDMVWPSGLPENQQL
jgi:L-galactose dehydrogenase